MPLKIKYSREILFPPQRPWAARSIWVILRGLISDRESTQSQLRLTKAHIVQASNLPHYPNLLTSFSQNGFRLRRQKRSRAPSHSEATTLLSSTCGHFAALWSQCLAECGDTTD